MTKLLHGFPVVDDSFAPATDFAGHGTGYTGRDLEAFPLHGLSVSRQPTIKRLSVAEIIELAVEKTAKQTWVTDLADRVGSKVKNQKQSSYCWIHAPTRGMEYARIHDGGALLVLSAFCGAYPIKHGRNEGGSGIQGVKSLAEHGTCTEALWPSMQFKGAMTPEITGNAELHQITIYEEFDADDKVGIWSSVVQDQPVTVGIPAWGHEVLLTFLALTNTAGKPTEGDLAEGFDNSWGPEWGKNGRGVLAGSKRKFDEAGRIAAIEQSVA